MGDGGVKVNDKWNEKKREKKEKQKKINKYYVELLNKNIKKIR